jgi:micrococcal nuclease
VEYFGKEASALTKQLVEGKEVRLEFDVQRRDKYQRTLAYVYVGEMMVNVELERQGYAQVATFPPNVKYQELLLQLQREAREAGRGLWGAK